jgi:Uma2 family endonuclease
MVRMAVAAPTTRYTIADLADFPDDGKLRELVDGRIVEWDVTTARHSFLETILARELSLFVRQHRLGRVGSGEGMVRIFGSEHDARGYDLAFYRHGNLPPDPDAPATVAVPDLVVEIISPSDRADRVFAKVEDWLRIGVRLLWYIDPESGVTTVYHGRLVGHVGPDEPLDGLDVLPGFQIRLRDLLDEIAEEETQP